MKTHLYALALLTCVINAVNVKAQESGQLTFQQYFSGEFFAKGNRETLPPFKWLEQGSSYAMIERNSDGQNELVKYNTITQQKSIILSVEQLTPKGAESPLKIEEFTISKEESYVLIFTNSKRVWRTNTKGDYWVFDLKKNTLNQIGEKFPESSLMFAKFSNNDNQIAYVMNSNIYMEDLESGKIIQLTFDGTNKIVNGTFDWAYEEEFFCRDGFQWSPNGNKIAYWQIDMSNIGTFNLINNTDSIYSKIIPMQYPKVGQDPSSAKIGILNASKGTTDWVKLEGSPTQNYIPRIQWIKDDLLLIQQINRAQNHLKIWTYTPSSKSTRLIYQEKEDTYVDILYPDITFKRSAEPLLFIKNDQFLRMTEDDWRNVYAINIKTGSKIRLSPGEYDVASIAGTSDNQLYFMASPENSTQRYLYQVGLNGDQNDIRITPNNYSGVNTYNISPNGKYALHTHTSSLKYQSIDLITLPDHKIIKSLVSNDKFQETINALDLPSIEFLSVEVEEGIELDARIYKPAQFDPSLKYPVIFRVYSEPVGQLATDSFVSLASVILSQQGYIFIEMDNRGTPCLKGSAWRQAIHGQIGRLNIKDLAIASKKLLELPYLDSERAGVWGVSGGGNATLNLMFQYPDIFEAGVAIASVADQRTYNTIYQERYMGLYSENKEDYIAGSPITYAKILKGNLLIIHGTADDNVHYQNTEMLINELIEHNKFFDLMIYPNRSHNLSEGKNTKAHLFTVILNYFRKHIPIKKETEVISETK